MKTFFRSLCLLLVFSTFQTFASDAESLKIKLDSLESFAADFTQTVIDEKGDVVHEATGHLTMTRPDKLRWETEFPDETVLIADGDSVWHMDYFVEQVTVMSQQQAIENNPMVLLTNNDPAVWAQYTIEQREVNEFAVSAKTGTGQIRSLVLNFDSQGMNALTMVDSQGQHSLIKFAQRDLNNPVDATAFEGTIPEGFMVDDQRP